MQYAAAAAADPRPRRERIIGFRIGIRAAMSSSSATTNVMAMPPAPAPPPPPPLPTMQRSGVGYGLFVSLGAMVTVTLVMLILYMLERLGLARTSTRAHAVAGTASSAVTAGLPAHAIDAIPKFVYDPQNRAIDIYKAKAMAKGEGGGGAEIMEEEDAGACCCCPICLGEYGVRVDAVRVMPECRHMFHAECLDEWLRRHPTCPVCRVSPLPTPLSQHTPLALADSLSSPR